MTNRQKKFVMSLIYSQDKMNQFSDGNVYIPINKKEFQTNFVSNIKR